MKTNLIALRWIVIAAAVAAPVAIACIPEGEAETLRGDRPPLPTSPDPNHPNSWSPDRDPNTVEDDGGDGFTAGADEDMGTATTVDTDTVKADIENDDGDLSGPNEEDQNGGTEGDCIEVKFCWLYNAWIPAQYIWLLEIYIPAHYEHRWVCTEPVEVCPCD